MELWGAGDIYPVAIDINEVLRKVRFFLGDKWVDVGGMEMIFQGRYAIDIQMPDIEEFFNRQFELDNGSADWLTWGTRMN